MFASEANPVRIAGPAVADQERILTPEAVRFLTGLATAFEPRRRALLEARQVRQERLDALELPEFPAETAEIRQAPWRVAEIPADLLDRRVEITGPTDRKMIINALNSGARVFMADFEDSNAPTWENMVQGQANLCDAVRGTITYDQPRGQALRIAPAARHPDGASARLAPGGEALSHRRRAHLGLAVRFRPVLLPQCRARCSANGTRAVFLPAEDGEPARGAPVERRVSWPRRTRSAFPRGTIRATVLIETILAAFEMEEILWELREHSAGSNCGRWDYIFSFIKKFRNRRRMRPAGPGPGDHDAAISWPPTWIC